MVRIFIVVACLVWPMQFYLLSSAASPSEKDAAKVEANEAAAVRECIRSFLSTWLIERDFVKALGSFSERSFSNQAMFYEDCSGYIEDTDRASPEAIRKGTQEFLRDFITGDDALRRYKTLDSALNVQPILPMVKKLGKNALNRNSFEADHFLVVHLMPAGIKSLIDEPKAAKFLKGQLPKSGFYVSFAAIGDGVVYFIWVKEGESWKIYHASMICM
jgi:hypothetical protein